MYTLILIESDIVNGGRKKLSFGSQNVPYFWHSSDAELQYFFLEAVVQTVSMSFLVTIFVTSFL